MKKMIKERSITPNKRNQPSTSTKVFPAKQSNQTSVKTSPQKEVQPPAQSIDQ
jgi:hypothetical protein